MSVLGRGFNVNNYNKMGYGCEGPGSESAGDLLIRPQAIDLLDEGLDPGIAGEKLWKHRQVRQSGARGARIEEKANYDVALRSSCET